MADDLREFLALWPVLPKGTMKVGATATIRIIFRGIWCSFQFVGGRCLHTHEREPTVALRGATSGDYPQTDTSISDLVRQQALYWAELFWTNR